MHIAEAVTFHKNLFVWCEKLRQYKVTVIFHKKLLVKCNMKGTWQGQESICRPVSLKSNLLLFAHWPADRLLALPGPFHVTQCP